MTSKDLDETKHLKSKTSHKPKILKIKKNTNFDGPSKTKMRMQLNRPKMLQKNGKNIGKNPSFTSNEFKTNFNANRNSNQTKR